LQWAAMKPGSPAVRAFLVVAARHCIQTEIMHADAERLLLILPAPEHGQDVERVGRRRREQGMPAILLGTGTHLAADNGTERLFGTFRFEYRLGLGQADFLGRRADTHARLVDRDEQTARQLFPSPQAMRITTGPQ